MTPGAALAALEALADPERADGMARYHKTDRRVLGLTAEAMNALAKEWRSSLDLPDRLALAEGLWCSGVFEARLTAAKVLTQARIRPDDTAAWDMLGGWVPDFDGWAIADTACAALSRRLTTKPERLDVVARWTRSDHLWTRRASLVATLPWARLRHPSPAETEARERILGWAADFVTDRTWFMQKAIAWWLRDLSRKDPDRVCAFMALHSDAMAGFARKEALRLIEYGRPQHN